ncbi:TraM recognition domain-containing protein, partial [Haladaptatus sp. CMAA 1909]
PVFRFLVDHSAMHALDDSSRWSYFVLDEFARIDGLRRIGELVNVGRGQKVQLLISLQSVSQLYDNYGRDRGNAILSGLVTSIILRLQDAESIEYARTVIGSEFNEYTKHESRDEEGAVMETETTTEEEHSFAKGEFTEFEPGHGVVVRRNSWAYGYIAALDRSGAKPLLNVVNE